MKTVNGTTKGIMVKRLKKDMSLLCTKCVRKNDENDGDLKNE